MPQHTTPAPSVGQIWQDNDPRGHGRRIRIVSVTGTHALVESLSPRRTRHLHAKPGRRTRIRLDRFKPTSTGYQYIRTDP